MKTSIKACLIILSLWISVGCSPMTALQPVSNQNTTLGSSPDAAPSPRPSRGTLGSATLVRDIPISDIQDISPTFGVPSAVKKALSKYGVEIYKLVYTTQDGDGKAIEASGAVLVPKLRNSLPIAIYMHGTISASNLEEVPSLGTGKEVTAVAAVAAQGYIVFMPDYIGYGESAGQDHPYLIVDPTVNSAVDMLKAGEVFLDQKQITTRSNSGMYITGYSQGGHAAMALHRALEESGKTVAVSVVGSGPYDLLLTIREAFNRSFVQLSEAYLWAVTSLLKSVNRYDLLNTILRNDINPPLNILDYVMAKKKGPADLKTITQADVIEAIRSNQPSLLRDLIDSQNAYRNWVPRAPIRMFHGKNDTLVSYSVSESVFRELTDKGADVILHSNSEDHIEGVPRYFAEVSLQFAAVRTGQDGYKLASDVLEILENGPWEFSLFDLLNQAANFAAEFFRSQWLSLVQASDTLS